MSCSLFGYQNSVSFLTYVVKVSNGYQSHWSCKQGPGHGVFASAEGSESDRVKGIITYHDLQFCTTLTEEHSHVVYRL